MKNPRTITIVETEHGFTIHEGERFCDQLCWDEMLGQIATMTHPMISGGRQPSKDFFGTKDADELVWGRMAKAFERRKEDQK